MNNNRTIEEILKNARSLSLHQKEKEELFSAINTFVHNHPAKKTQYSQPTKSPYFSFSIFTRHAQFASYAILLFVVLGSTSAAAQYSLPGDMLYRVKVLNEEVRSFLAVSQKAKAVFEVKRVEERLKEAKVLAVKGELSTKVQREIETNFARHASKVETQINQLSEDGNLKDALVVSSDFELALRSSENQLEKIDETGSENQETDLQNIVKKVEEHLEKSSIARTKTETDITNSKDEDAIELAAEKKLDAVKSILKMIDETNDETNSEKEGATDSEALTNDAEKTETENVENSVSDTTDTALTTTETPNAETLDKPIAISLMKVETEVPEKSPRETIQELVFQGEEKMKEGQFDEAFIIFSEAFEMAENLQILNELSLIYKAQLNGDIDDFELNLPSEIISGEIQGTTTQIEEKDKRELQKREDTTKNKESISGNTSTNISDLGI